MNETTVAESRQRAWDIREKRVSHKATKEQIEDFIQYKGVVPESSVNALRDELIEFINNNRNRLSLPCGGDCYQHHDGVVLFCHSQFIEDANANSSKKEAKTNEEDARKPRSS